MDSSEQAQMPGGTTPGESHYSTDFTTDSPLPDASQPSQSQPAARSRLGLAALLDTTPPSVHRPGGTTTDPHSQGLLQTNSPQSTSPAAVEQQAGDLPPPDDTQNFRLDLSPASCQVRPQAGLDDEINKESEPSQGLQSHHVSTLSATNPGDSSPEGTPWLTRHLRGQGPTLTGVLHLTPQPLLAASYAASTQPSNAESEHYGTPDKDAGGGVQPRSYAQQPESGGDMGRGVGTVGEVAQATESGGEVGRVVGNNLPRGGRSRLGVAEGPSSSQVAPVGYDSGAMEDVGQGASAMGDATSDVGGRAAWDSPRGHRALQEHAGGVTPRLLGSRWDDAASGDPDIQRRLFEPESAASPSHAGAQNEAGSAVRAVFVQSSPQQPKKTAAVGVGEQWGREVGPPSQQMGDSPGAGNNPLGAGGGEDSFSDPGVPRGSPWVAREAAEVRLSHQDGLEGRSHPGEGAGLLALKEPVHMQRSPTHVVPSRSGQGTPPEFSPAPKAHRYAVSPSSTWSPAPAHVYHASAAHHPRTVPHDSQTRSGEQLFQPAEQCRTPMSRGGLGVERGGLGQSGEDMGGEAARKRLSELYREVLELREAKGKLEVEVAALEGSVEFWRTARDEAVADSAVAREQLAAVEQQKEQEVTAMEAQVEQANRAVQQAMTSATAPSSPGPDGGLTEHLIDQLNADNQRLSAENRRLVAEARQARDEVTSARSQTAQLREDLATAQARLRRLSSPAGVQERLRHAREVSGLKDELARLGEEAATGQARLAEAARVMQEQRARILHLEDSLADAPSLTRAASAQREASQLASQLASKAAYADSMAADNHRLAEHMRILESDLLHVRQQLQAQDGNPQGGTQSADLAAEVARLTSALHSERESHARADAHASGATELAAQLRARDEELEKVREAGRRTQRELKDKLRVAEGQLKRLEVDVEGYKKRGQARVQRLEGDLATKERALEARETELQLLATRLTQAEGQENLDPQRGGNADPASKVSSETVERLASAEAEVSRCHEELTAQQAEVLGLKAQVEVLQDQADSLGGRLSRLAVEHGQLLQAEDLRKKYQQLLQAYYDYVNHYKMLRGKVEQAIQLYIASQAEAPTS